MPKQDKNNGREFISGVVWSYGEKLGAELVGFAVGIVLARILSPEHYGTIALISIFIQIANTFVTAGFGNALIQKKDASELDFSSIFYFSVTFSILLYMVMFFSAPLIANFYNDQSLILILRVMALRLPIAAINSVQRAYVAKKMLFKKFFFSTLGGTIVAAVVGIFMAYKGFGVWALVAQYLVNACIDTIVLFFTTDWRPKLMFSFERTKQLISYGWKLLAAALLNTLYSSLSNLLIAKKYSSEDLAFYTRGYNYPRLISDNVNASVSSVLFSVLSKSQDNIEQIKNTVRKTIRILMFVLSPMLLGFAAVATPLVKILLTDKWLPCAPYIQIMCIVWLMQPIQSCVIQAMTAVGRSGAYLKLEVVKKVLNLAVLLIAVFLFNSPIYIAWSLVIGQIISTVLNMPTNKKILGYSYIEQLADSLLSMLISFLMWFSIRLFGFIISDIYLLLVVQVIAGAAFYVGVNALIKNPAFKETWTVLKKIFRKD